MAAGADTGRETVGPGGVSFTALSIAQQRGHEHVAHELLMSKRPLTLDADEDAEAGEDENENEDEAELARALKLSMAGGDDGEAEAEAQVGRAR